MENNQKRDFSKKIIGGYKRKKWAERVFDKMSIVMEEDGELIKKGLLSAQDSTYFPVFLAFETGKETLKGVYFISESEDQYNLIPYELAKEFLTKKAEELEPFSYELV